MKSSFKFVRFFPGGGSFLQDYPYKKGQRAYASVLKVFSNIFLLTGQSYRPAGPNPGLPC